jgi:hypothetical protein
MALGYQDNKRGHYIPNNQRADYQAVPIRQGGNDLGQMEIAPTIPGRGAGGYNGPAQNRIPLGAS